MSVAGHYLSHLTPREREQIYGTIVEAAGEGVWVLDANHVTTFVNPRMAAMLGYTVEEMLGAGMETFFEVGEQDAIRAASAGRTPGLPPQLDVRYRCKDGAAVWTHVRVNELTDGSGGYTGAVLLVSDLTEHRQADQLHAALNRISHAINATLNQAEIMQRVMRETAQALACDTASIILHEGGRWVIRYAHGFPGDVVGRAFDDQAMQHAVLAAEARDPVVVEDALHDAAIDSGDAKAYGVRSFMVVPLIARQEVLGVVFLNYHSQAVHFTPPQIDFARQLASSLSLALENARLYAEAQDARAALEARVVERTASLVQATAELERSNAALSTYADQMAALASISQSLAEAGFDSEAILETIARRTVELIGDSCAIGEVTSEGSLVPVTVYHRDPEAIPFLRAVYMPDSGQANLRVSRQVVESGQAVLVPVVPEAEQRAAVPPGQQGNLKKYGIHSILVVPLRARGRAIGALAVARDRPGRPYTAEDQTFLQALADRTALALAGAQLYQELAGANQALAQREQELSQAAARLQEEIAERARAESQLAYQAHVLAHVTDAVYATGADLRITAWNRAAEELFGVPAAEALGRSLNEVLTGAFIEPDEKRAGEMVAATGRYRGLIRYDRRDGTFIISETTGMVLRDESGTITGYLGVNRDITERKQAEAERDASLQALARQTQRLHILHDIDRAVLSAQSPGQIAQIVVERLRQLLACDRAVVLLYDAEREEVERLAVAGRDLPGIGVGSRVRLADYAPALAGDPTRIYVVPDLGAWEYATPLLREFHGAGLDAFVTVPLITNDLLVGHLNLHWAEPRAFDQHEVDTARQVGDSLAVALQNAQLFAELEQERQRQQALARRLVEASENERRTIARELHDEAGQALTSLIISLGLLKGEASDPAAVVARAQDLQATVDGVLEGLHRLAVNLRPASLDRLGLVAALKQHVETFRQQSGLEVALETLQLEQDAGEANSGKALSIPRLPPEVEITLYRIIQEALTNVARHAQASHVGIVLQRRGDRLIATVEDNGVGFDLEAALAQGRLGIFGMRERAEMLGGTLMVESGPGHGTTVFVEVPCPAPAAPADHTGAPSA